MGSRVLLLPFSIPKAIDKLALALVNNRNIILHLMFTTATATTTIATTERKLLKKIWMEEKQNNDNSLKKLTFGFETFFVVDLKQRNDYFKTTSTRTFLHSSFR